MKLLKKIIPFLAVLPLIIGTLGYCFSGEKLSDALYASFALYFISPISDKYNIFIEIARWTSAVVTTSAILYVAKRIWLAIVQFLYCLSKDSIAVYSDKEIRIVFDDPKKKVIYPGRKFRAAAKSQIIMFESDVDSLKFYEEHKNGMKKCKVYIALNDVSCAALKDNENINYFDICSGIARNLWKHIALWAKCPQKVKITVLGSEHLGQLILNCGLLLNLYSLGQEITYNFIGENNIYQASHGDIDTFNKDTVRYYKADEDVTNIIQESDIVIVSESISIERMYALSMMCSGKVYFYSPDNDLSNYMYFPNAEMFGKSSEIYTDENIRQNKMISDAIDAHYNYLKKTCGDTNREFDKNAEWNKLSGFLKLSNISSADYKQVLISLFKNAQYNEEELAELEHTRWCRFHIINYWKYGIPENGKNKDESKRIHKCLCRYSELSERDKVKDIDTVKEVRKQFCQNTQ